MKRNGIFIDPALGKDRFDFSGEPLIEEGFEKSKIYVHDIGKAPKSAVIHRGKRGGYFYEPPKLKGKAKISDEEYNKIHYNLSYQQKGDESVPYESRVRSVYESKIVSIYNQFGYSSLIRDRLNNFTKDHKNDSGDSMSLAFQFYCAEKLGKDTDDFIKWIESEHPWIKNENFIEKVFKESAKTKEFFDAQKRVIEYIFDDNILCLFRGSGRGVEKGHKKGDKVNIHSKWPVDRWTFDKNVANHFAREKDGVVLRALVPASKVWFMDGVSGIGSGWEWEREVDIDTEGLEAEVIYVPEYKEGMQEKPTIYKGSEIKEIDLSDEQDWIIDIREDEIEKSRIYIHDPSHAPKGVSIQRGRKGGLYYESIKNVIHSPFVQKLKVKPHAIEKVKLIKVSKDIDADAALDYMRRITSLIPPERFGDEKGEFYISGFTTQFTKRSGAIAGFNRIILPKDILTNPDYCFSTHRSLGDKANVALILHEIGHILNTGFDRDDLAQLHYNALKRWKKGEASTVTRYALKNAEEFFAESYAYFIIAPERLKEVDPDTYNYFKSGKRFGDEKPGVGPEGLEKQSNLSQDDIDEGSRIYEEAYEESEHFLKKHDTIDKAKIYVKEPGKAPEGVQVERGKRGGLYYETKAGVRLEKPKVKEKINWNHKGLSDSIFHFTGDGKDVIANEISKLPEDLFVEPVKFYIQDDDIIADKFVFDVPIAFFDGNTKSIIINKNFYLYREEYLDKMLNFLPNVSKDKLELSLYMHELGHFVDSSYIGDFSEIKRERRVSASCFGTTNERLVGDLLSLFDEIRLKLYKQKGVTVYSESNDREFFAESFMFYIVAPDILKRRNSHMYEWLKREIFKGLEYPPESKEVEKQEDAEDIDIGMIIMEQPRKAEEKYPEYL